MYAIEAAEDKHRKQIGFPENWCKPLFPTIITAVRFFYFILFQPQFRYKNDWFFVGSVCGK